MLTRRNIGLILFGVIIALTLNSCTSLTVTEYQATAETTITWRVEYFYSEKQSRFVEFASNSLVNVNGEKPEGAFGEADDKGLWWPAIPEKPTLDEIEKLQQPGEQRRDPERLRTVKYYFSFEQGGQTVNLPTNYSVYRQAVKAYESGQSLRLTLSIDDSSVEKAEPR
jgi:hypothetical protein